MRSSFSCCSGGRESAGSEENTRESLPLSQLFMVEKVRKNVGKCGGGWSAVKAIKEAQPLESDRAIEKILFLMGNEERASEESSEEIQHVRWGLGWCWDFYGWKRRGSPLPAFAEFRVEDPGLGRLASRAHAQEMLEKRLESACTRTERAVNIRWEPGP